MISAGMLTQVAGLVPVPRGIALIQLARGPRIRRHGSQLLAGTTPSLVLCASQLTALPFIANGFGEGQGPAEVTNGYRLCQSRHPRPTETPSCPEDSR